MRREDNRMSVYVIAQGKIENRGLIDQYVAKVIPTIESHQGRIVAFDEEPEVVEGPTCLRRHPATAYLFLLRRLHGKPIPSSAGGRAVSR